MRKLPTNLEITPKRLGMIAVKKYCPRDFWYLLQFRFRPPFNSFGGAIFKQMEQIQMAIVWYFLNKDGELPAEFAPFCDLVSRVEFPRHWSTYKYLLDSGVLLYGEPDDILNVSDGTIAIVDHKTAFNKGGEDPFLPCYEIQCIGYGMIAEHGLKLGTVSKAGLFYWEVQHKAVQADPAKFYKDKKVWAPFVPKPLLVEMDYSRLAPVLKEAEKVWDAKTPPKGAEGCEDCEKLEALFAMQAQIERQLMKNDQKVLAMSGNDRLIANNIQQENYDRNRTRIEALLKVQDFQFAADGIVANWDLFDDGF